MFTLSESAKYLIRFSQFVPLPDTKIAIFNFYLFIIIPLHQVLDEVCAVAGQHVDDGNFDHRVAAGLQTH